MSKTISRSLKFPDFLTSMNRGEAYHPPIVLFHGEESFFIQKGLDILKEKLLDYPSDALNSQTYFGHESKARDIMNACQTLPFLSKTRLVILKGFDTMASAEQEYLLPYFKDPSPTTHLILSAEKIDLRKKTCQAILKTGLIVSCNSPYESQIHFWIKDMANTLDLSLSEEAVIELKERIGNDLLKLHTELEKISLYYLNQRKKLNREDVSVVLGGEKDQSVFDLTRAIGQKNLEGTLKILKKILESGEHPLMVLTFLVRQYRLIWRIKELISRGTPQEEIPKILGIHPFYGQTLQKQAPLYSENQLQNCFKRFKETDSALKESFQNPKIILERLVMGLCQPKRHSLVSERLLR